MNVDLWLYMFRLDVLGGPPQSGSGCILARNSECMILTTQPTSLVLNMGHVRYNRKRNALKVPLAFLAAGYLATFV
jgi:hypothetical protein